MQQQVLKKKETDKRTKMCSKKKVFGNFEKARQFCKHSKRKHGQWLRPYECPICGKFHVTSKGY